MDRGEEWRDRIRIARYDALLDGDEWEDTGDVLWDLCASAYRDGVMDGACGALWDDVGPTPAGRRAAGRIIMVYEAVTAWLRSAEPNEEEHEEEHEEDEERGQRTDNR